MAKTELRQYIVDLIENDVHFHHKITDEKHTVTVFVNGTKMVSSYFSKEDESEWISSKHKYVRTYINKLLTNK
tara:strand:- start:137 stop:355 length:219 start_codon:yes stop_codon:yes gene_type:complete